MQFSTLHTLWPLTPAFASVFTTFAHFYPLHQPLHPCTNLCTRCPLAPLHRPFTLTLTFTLFGPSFTFSSDHLHQPLHPCTTLVSFAQAFTLLGNLFTFHTSLCTNLQTLCAFHISHPLHQTLPSLWSFIFSQLVCFLPLHWSLYSLPPSYPWHTGVFLKKIFEDISPFRWATDTPVLGFWWCLLWVSKRGLDPFCVLFCLCDPQIHLWWDTCWLYRGQHGSRAFSIHVTWNTVT